MSPPLSSSNQFQGADSEICFTGYVMDSYCIDRGTLFDLPAVETLANPDEHSVHCLVDVKRCVASGYQMLVDPPSDSSIGGGLHCAALRLDEYGNSLMVELARMAGEGGGSCRTCTGSSTGLNSGFRATVFGHIMNDTSADTGGHAPPLLAVTRIESSRVLCPEDQLYIPPASATSCASGSYLPFIVSHGTLMMLSWGFLLPVGILSAKLLKHRPNSIWFKIHRIFQPLGLLVALSGYVTALAGPFNIFGSGVFDISFFHALLGTIVMILGIQQPLNAFFRPHKPEEDTPEAEKRKRVKWEILHRTTGWTAGVLGICNVLIGVVLSGYYQGEFFVGILVVGVLFVGFIVWAKCDERKYPNRNDNSEQERQPTIEENDGEGDHEDQTVEGKVDNEE